MTLIPALQFIVFALLFRQLESREWFGFAFDYVVEPILPSVGLGVEDVSVGEAGLPVLIGKDEVKFIFFGRSESDGFRRRPAVDIQPHAGVLLGLLVPADEHRGFILRIMLVVLLP